MDVSKDATRDADGEDGQVALGLVLDTTGDVDHDSRVQLDLRIVEDHGSPAGDDVVKLVGPFMVVQFGVMDPNMVDLAGGAVLLFDKAANLPAGFRPRLNLGRVATQELHCDRHGISFVVDLSSEAVPTWSLTLRRLLCFRLVIV